MFQQPPIYGGQGPVEVDAVQQARRDQFERQQASQIDSTTRAHYDALNREDAAIRREQAQERQHQRGRELAGYALRDLRASGGGWQWQPQRPPEFPEHTPPQLRAAVSQAINADRAARMAFDAQVQQFQEWAHSHPSASQELRRVKYEELTIDAQANGERTASALMQACTALGALAEAIDQWQAVERTADARMDAAERQYDQAIATIEAELTTARTKAARLGVAI